MNISFATCDRNTALGFIQRVYPNHVITDTPESVGKVLDFVEKDYIRVQDPMMYGKRIALESGKKYDESKMPEIMTAVNAFMETVK